MNEWIYRNSIAEYEQRLKTIDNERRARELNNQQPRGQMLRTFAASLRQYLRHNREASVQLQPRI